MGQLGGCYEFAGRKKGIVILVRRISQKIERLYFTSFFLQLFE
jgi:hypothetical protein